MYLSFLGAYELMARVRICPLFSESSSPERKKYKKLVTGCRVGLSRTPLPYCCPSAWMHPKQGFDPPGRVLRLSCVPFRSVAAFIPQEEITMAILFLVSTDPGPWHRTWNCWPLLV